MNTHILLKGASPAGQTLTTVGVEMRAALTARSTLFSSSVMLSLGGQVLMSDPASALGFLQTCLHSFLDAEVLGMLSSMFDEQHQ